MSIAGVPRTSEAKTRKSHGRIIDPAAHLFRNKGVGATGTSDAMQATGLTHGGFYRRFSSKKDLIEAALKKPADDLIANMEAVDAERQREQARQAYISQYLSLGHANNAGGGCPFAAMGAEVSRMGGDLKSKTSEAIGRTAHLLDQSSDQVAAQGIATLAAHMGTISLARLAKSQQEASQITEAGKEGVRSIRKG